MQKRTYVNRARVVLLAFGVFGLSLCSTAGNAATLPQSTTLPARFSHSVDASKARPGDTVTAKTLQVVLLPGGESLPKGTVIVGHVVAASPFQFDTTPYAHQQPSRLSIHFDHVQNGNQSLAVTLSVRALANTIDSRQAASPHFTDETDRPGTMMLIGGYSFSPLDKTIQADDGDVIGYNRKQGVYARLLQSGYTTPEGAVRCDSTGTEQAIAIFSPSACGIYGFDKMYMPDGGQNGSGTFTLAARGHSVKLYEGSTALLQVTEAQ